MGKIIMCNIEDLKKTFLEERREWIFEVLISIGIDEETIALYKTNPREFRARMDDIGVEIITHSNLDVDVYKLEFYENEETGENGWLPEDEKYLVAQWKEPTIIRKKDEYGSFYEIELNEWSLKMI